TMPLSRHTGQIPESNWTLGFREMTEPWKGAVGCLGVAVFFAMTIGIISWQALEQSPEEWVLRGRAGGMLWERRRGALALKGSVRRGRRNPVRARCPVVGSPQDREESRMGRLLPASPNLTFLLTLSLPCSLTMLSWLQDCFSMANVSWYGGPSIRAQRWPLNGAESPAQPFVSGDLGTNPDGFGPVLDRYFLGSTAALNCCSHCMLSKKGRNGRNLALERHFGGYKGTAGTEWGRSAWLDLRWDQSGSRQPRPGGSTVQDTGPPSTLNPKLALDKPPRVYYLQGEQPSAPVLGHGSAVGSSFSPGSYGSSLEIPTLPKDFKKLPVFRKSLNSIFFWFFLCHFRPHPQIPLLTTWKGQLCARLNVTSEAALAWYLARARRLRQALGATYVAFEGVEGNSFLEQDVPPPAELAGDGYTRVLAAALATLGNGTVVSAGAISSHLPLFVQMSPLRSDWSHAGLKGLIPSVLHYSLLGYNFFIPDTVGGSLAGDSAGDPELFVRWLQIVTFLPVMAFGSPPWLCCDSWVLNLTRQCIQRHRDFVLPLLLKYSEEWQSLGHPIFRPAWWLSPTDPTAFTIEDEFLIGDEVLVAPITEKGQRWRDVFLPGEGHLWLDTNSARVFDGGTILRNYSASLAEVPVFVK
ncbi:SITS-binding protein, partial [Manacus vitellinus]